MSSTLKEWTVPPMEPLTTAGRPPVPPRLIFTGYPQPPDHSGRGPNVRPLSAVLVDLDDTLCDSDHRHHLLGPENTSPSSDEWDAYHLACVDDPPINWTIDLVRHWFGTHYVALISGRGTIALQPTLQWLAHYSVPYNEIQLRPKEDRKSSNPEFKLAYAKQLATRMPLAFGMDDHPGVAKAYASIGVPTLLVQRPESRHTKGWNF